MARIVWIPITGEWRAVDDREEFLVVYSVPPLPRPLNCEPSAPVTLKVHKDVLKIELYDGGVWIATRIDQPIIHPNNNPTRQGDRPT